MSLQNPTTLLCVEKLKIIIPTLLGSIHAVDDVSFSLKSGKTLGIVGESGCGKSVLCKSILGLLPKNATVSGASRIIFEGQTLNSLNDNDLNKIRGQEIAIIFQDPMTALNPVMTIGKQIAEPLLLHRGMQAEEAREHTLKLMESVGITKPHLRLKQYPHQLSGGLRQRVVIAMALSCNPKLLIADEPTTALDVTVQAEVLNLLDTLKSKNNMAMILITHDLSIAAARCQDIAVMYAGKFVEQAPTKELFSHIKMPYTLALFNSRPRLENPVHTPFATIEGQPPAVNSKLAGCSFAPRCMYSTIRCFQESPKLSSENNTDHKVACWHPLPPIHEIIGNE